jgi:hypothetical protein
VAAVPGDVSPTPIIIIKKIKKTVHSTAFARGFNKPPAVPFYPIHSTDLGRIMDIQTCGGNTNTHGILRGPKFAGPSSNEADL